MTINTLRHRTTPQQRHRTRRHQSQQARRPTARGRTDRIPKLWRRLKQHYADEIADTITTPTIETELAFTALVDSS